MKSNYLANNVSHFGLDFLPKVLAMKYLELFPQFQMATKLFQKLTQISSTTRNSLSKRAKILQMLQQMKMSLKILNAN